MSDVLVWPLTKHGTRCMYNHYGCRCGHCRGANARYQKRYRLTVKVKRAEAPNVA